MCQIPSLLRHISIMLGLLSSCGCYEQIPLHVLASSLVCIYSEVELLGHKIILLFSFGGTAILFSIVAASFYVQLGSSFNRAQNIEFSF